MAQSNRREFVYSGLAAAAAAVAGNAQATERKFTLAFTPGSIGVTADQGRSIELAAKYGYESVQPFGPQLLKEGVSRYVEALKSNKLKWAAASLSASFRNESDRRPAVAEAKALQQAGVTRVGTAVSSRSDTLTYLENLKQTSRRLRGAASVLEDHGLRLGLEYLGTKRLWTAQRHPFVHSMAECKELIAEIGKSNVGFVLDSWHWWTARETADDILTLSNSDVVSADLNDAPSGIEREEQYDRQRALPATTGMIDVKAFLNALIKIGYDGPVRPEPFSQRLNEMDDEQASKTTAIAMKKAFALAG